MNFKIDWQTWAAAGALLVMLGGAIRSNFAHPSQREESVGNAHEVPLPKTVRAQMQNALSPPAAAIIYAADAVVTSARTPGEQDGHLASIGLQQLDYEKLSTMKTQVIERFRRQIREHGVGANGVTEADLDRMLKNDQVPQ